MKMDVQRNPSESVSVHIRRIIYTFPVDFIAEKHIIESSPDFIGAYAAGKCRWKKDGAKTMKGEKKRIPDAQDRIRNFACWSQTQEERWLAKRAACGWQLYAAAGACIYRFHRAEPQNLRYAVEYIGSEPDVPEQLAELCNQGWEYLGRFGSKRYFCAPADSRLPHPSQGRPAAVRRLHTAQSNLTTAGLLNIPGTLYCLLYIALFLGNGAFYFTDLFAQNTDSWLYLAGLLLGAASIAYVLRSILRIRKRLRLLGEPDMPAPNG